ncbi:uncharacterized protein LOC126854541 isoform X1 [Cataglyphis hispanica]|uniref:uncharacterized protein LOC126854541 isoform X1 n=1 Tax=Cataglyphis hispanica TaxID=1086592 RepID=UPI0021807410|nr:uncharacterized protein LOC126854541 isoform X1 [Cataglyphis hispanica]
MIKVLSPCHSTVKIVCRHAPVYKRVISKTETLFGAIVYIDSCQYSSKVFNKFEEFGKSIKVNMDVFKFTDYDCIGFDLDNTLLRYNITNLVQREYEILARFLVDERKYSAKHLLKPLTDNDLDFMQKGLLLDAERGNILRIRIIPAIKEQLKQLSGPSKEMKNTKYTFKNKRIQQRQQEGLAAVEQILESRDETQNK